MSRGAWKGPRFPGSGPRSRPRLDPLLPVSAVRVLLNFDFVPKASYPRGLCAGGSPGKSAFGLLLLLS